MFNRLYIIGNGFDIAHGYNTQFKNFLEWMQIYYPNDYWTFSTYFDEYLLWNNFELLESGGNRHLESGRINQF